MRRAYHLAISRAYRIVSDAIRSWSLIDGWRGDTWVWFASRAWAHEEVAEGRL